jgi:hypothetical protein
MVYQGRLSPLCLSPVEVSQLVDFCQTVILGDGTQGTAQGLTATTPAKARIAVAVAVAEKDSRETIQQSRTTPGRRGTKHSSPNILSANSSHGLPRERPFHENLDGPVTVRIGFVVREINHLPSPLSSAVGNLHCLVHCIVPLRMCFGREVGIPPLPRVPLAIGRQPPTRPGRRSAHLVNPKAHRATPHDPRECSTNLLQRFPAVPEGA